jgi:hypothetical protein
MASSASWEVAENTYWIRVFLQTIDKTSVGCHVFWHTPHVVKECFLDELS